MISNTILELLHQYGYLIVYFAFSLGPFGIPIQMINHKFQHHKHFIKAELILNKSGNWAMCIGLFIPIV
ncbi:hypothetical protein [Paenibacillus sp. FSL R5-0701]|uniref:hypothetical protein n=1 Tax=Paenibacillus sp. FSL R5-0701 TaxID=2921654 RepID=UPI0030CD44C2